MHHGIIADYDIYGGDEAKWAKRDDPLYVDEGRIVMMICGFRCTVGTGIHQEFQRRDQHGKFLVHHKQNDDGDV